MIIQAVGVLNLLDVGLNIVAYYPLEDLMLQKSLSFFQYLPYSEDTTCR